MPFLGIWSLPALIVVFAIVLPGAYATYSGAPFVPTPKKVLQRMIELAHIKPDSTVYDLGCGDGRLVFAAAKLGAKAIGYEYSLPTFLLAKVRSIFHTRASIRFGNFWVQDLHNADVIFCYLLTDSMQTFKMKIWPTLKPGCRIVSHSFRMKDITPAEEEKGIVVYVK